MQHNSSHYKVSKGCSLICHGYLPSDAWICFIKVADCRVGKEGFPILLNRARRREQEDKELVYAQNGQNRKMRRKKGTILFIYCSRNELH